MREDEAANTCLGSTTWEWKRVKVPMRPKGHVKQPPKASARSPRDARDPLTITVTYRAGAECWWQVSARGTVYRFPGATALHDVMRHILNIDHPK